MATAQAPLTQNTPLGITELTAIQARLGRLIGDRRRQRPARCHCRPSATGRPSALPPGTPPPTQAPTPSTDAAVDLATVAGAVPEALPVDLADLTIDAANSGTFARAAA